VHDRYSENPIDKEFMNYFKMGSDHFTFLYSLPPPAGTNYSYHCRAALFNDATHFPNWQARLQSAYSCQRDLKAGEILDGIAAFNLLRRN